MARLFFIFVHYHISFQNSLADLSATFLHGSKLDVSLTGYYLLFPVLLMIAGVYFNGDWFRTVIRWYSYFAIVLSSTIIVADANLYSYWGFRMDFTPVLYLKTPGEAMASLSTMQIILFFIVIGLMAGFSIYIVFPG